LVKPPIGSEQREAGKHSVVLTLYASREKYDQDGDRRARATTGLLLKVVRAS
jgi:hypothetical protein